MKKGKYPRKTGNYWVKTNGYEWFNGIAKVYGEFPFYKVDGWDWANDRRITDISNIDEFGKQIKQPE
ncbi:hypothetical protein DMB45_00340 [Sanguibacteroides justesenii]|uniref:hypothetical protein n=1 Tax=Sanguibacteroides justesenii TaxID=1547597 RepID=UPI000D80A73B|nr:hypothetical protein [Sanguibacteroides justesenii]PXZ44932.1 hypothetical protein DMB45_00340 [Sanguibacteroides justesenii]